MVETINESLGQATSNLHSAQLKSKITELSSSLFDEAFGSKAISGFLTTKSGEAEKFTNDFIKSMQNLFATMDKQGGQLTDSNLIKIARAMVEAGQLAEGVYDRLTKTLTEHANYVKTKSDVMVSALTELKGRSFDEAGVKEAVQRLAESGQVSRLVLYDLQEALDENAQKARLAEQANEAAAKAGEQAAKVTDDAAAARLLSIQKQYEQEAQAYKSQELSLDKILDSLIARYSQPRLPENVRLASSPITEKDAFPKRKDVGGSAQAAKETAAATKEATAAEQEHTAAAQKTKQAKQETAKAAKESSEATKQDVTAEQTHTEAVQRTKRAKKESQDASKQAAESANAEAAAEEKVAKAAQDAARAKSGGGKNPPDESPDEGDIRDALLLIQGYKDTA